MEAVRRTQWAASACSPNGVDLDRKSSLSTFSLIRMPEATIIDLTPKERGVEGGAVEDALRSALCALREG